MVDKGILWTIGTAFIGLLFSYMIYRYTKESRLPTYQTTDDPTIIYDPLDQDNIIKVLVEDTVLVDSPIYVNKIKIWNGGTAQINKTDVRKPLTISLLGGDKIIDYKVLFQTEDGIPDFKLTQLNDTVLSIDFKYFDPNNGFLSQITYSGPKRSSLVVEGSVIGSSVQYLREGEILGVRLVVASLAFCFGVYLLGGGLFVLYGSWRDRSKESMQYNANVYGWLIGVGAILTIMSLSGGIRLLTKFGNAPF